MQSNSKTVTIDTCPLCTTVICLPGTLRDLTCSLSFTTLLTGQTSRRSLCKLIPMPKLLNVKIKHRLIPRQLRLRRRLKPRPYPLLLVVIGKSQARPVWKTTRIGFSFTIRLVATLAIPLAHWSTFTHAVAGRQKQRKDFLALSQVSLPESQFSSFRPCTIQLLQWRPH